jgi:hypothetical protein
VRRDRPAAVLRFRGADGGEHGTRVDQILVGADRALRISASGRRRTGRSAARRRRGRPPAHRNPRSSPAATLAMDWKFTHAADFAARIVIRTRSSSVASG